MTDENPTESTVVRPTLAGRIGSLFVTALLGAVGLFMFGATAIAIWSGNLVIGLVVAAVSGIFVLLFLYVMRDLRGKQGWRVGVGTDFLNLDLPKSRSLIHRLAPVHAK